MLRRLFALTLALALTAPFFARAASSGFYGVGGATETTNSYFIDYQNAVMVDNKEVIDDFNYDEFHAGSTLYVPVMVYVGNTGGEPTPATDKQVKDDDLGVGAKALIGSEHVGEITLVDGKKEKIDNLPNGLYVKIPLIKHYENFEKDEILIRFSLSVNGAGYPDTTVNLSCYIINLIQYIDKNSVYTAKHPTQFHVWPNYSGEVTFDFGENIKYTNRVRGGSDYYFNLSREPDENVTKMYDDKKLYLEFYNFQGGEDVFSREGDLVIPVNRAKLAPKKGDPEQLFVYKVGNGSLSAMGEDEVSFDAKASKLTINTKSLDYYVLSNMPLFQELNGGMGDQGILQTGYAETVMEEEPDALEDGTQPLGERAASSASSQAATSRAAASAPASSAGNAPVSTGATAAASRPATTADPLERDSAALNETDQTLLTDEDGYVPEEEFFSETSYTDAPISTANQGSAGNPSTGDSAKVFPALLVMCLSGAYLLLSRKRAPR